ncbi:hypothetical protein MKX31_02995 [Bacillus sp. FSL M8-0063]|uniref:hypothetical protein n=1 Tax=Bacillus TaxID=1386 RepID=UPI001F09407F|nr:hypothetical protein [Bacillus mycoides]
MLKKIMNRSEALKRKQFSQIGLVRHPNERRRKLIGSAVNLASHLCEGISKTGGGILVCNETSKILEGNNLKVTEFDGSYAKAYTIQTKSKSLSY